MEGYLYKKGRGESSFFSRKNWKKRWFTLDGDYITYYGKQNENNYHSSIRIYTNDILLLNVQNTLILT